MSDAGASLTSEWQVRSRLDLLARDIGRAVDEDIEISYPRRLYFRSPNGMKYRVDLTDDPKLIITDITGFATIIGPGTPGPMGPAGNNTITATAGEVLGGDRVVYISTSDSKAYYANQASPNCRATIGLTTGAAAAGAAATIQVDGVIENLGWSWSGPGPVYLLSSGLISQSAPPSGFIMQVGAPVGATKLRIEPQLVAFI